MPLDEPPDNSSPGLRRALVRVGKLGGSWKLYRPVGGNTCNNGYRGRVGLYQMMPMAEGIQRIVLRDSRALEVAKPAQRDGVKTLRDAEPGKVRAGLTSLEEALAISNE